MNRGTAEPVPAAAFRTARTGHQASTARTCRRRAGEVFAAGIGRRKVVRHMTTHTPIHARQVRPLGVASRLLLTAVGAAGLIASGFLKWTRDMRGIDTSWRAVYQDTFGSAPDSFRSVGGPAILLGLLAVLGLAERTCWLTRLAGALGVIGVVLVVVQIERASDHGMQWGLWSALGGSILCIAAGMTPMRHVVTTVGEETVED